MNSGPAPQGRLNEREPGLRRGEVEYVRLGFPTYFLAIGWLRDGKICRGDQSYSQNGTAAVLPNYLFRNCFVEACSARTLWRRTRIGRYVNSGGLLLCCSLHHERKGELLA